MFKFNKSKLYPDHYRSVSALVDMCRGLNTNEFIGLEYSPDGRTQKFVLVMGIGEYEWRTLNTDILLCSPNKNRLSVILSAECSYVQYYIFDTEKEMIEWSKIKQQEDKELEKVCGEGLEKLKKYKKG